MDEIVNEYTVVGTRCFLQLLTDHRVVSEGKECKLKSTIVKAPAQSLRRRKCNNATSVDVQILATS